MKIVIDINEHLYKMIKTVGLVVDDEDAVAVSEAIMNGTPLPKGHGRLKDVDWIYNHTPTHWDDEDGSPCVTWEEIYDAPTIIEADKENNV